LIETHIKPGVLEAHSRLIDDFADVTEQVEKQVERLIELKVKRDANPGTFFPFLLLLDSVHPSTNYFVVSPRHETWNMPND
jgi:hypothetical protein